MKFEINNLEKKILDTLVANGYDAMIVGGAVRDYLLEKDFNDVDIVTNASYDALLSMMDGLAEIKLVGSSFNVLIVGGVEVATYRSEVCEDNKVIELELTTSMRDDSNRRDFTVNALYYNYKNNEIYDFHDGADDLMEKQLIRTVGNAHARFHEDYSRILRALYLSAKLNLEIEYQTGKAIMSIGHLILEIPNALKGRIVRKVIESGCFYKFIKLLRDYNLLQYMFPEMLHTIDLPQNPTYHKFDVWNHTLAVVKSAEKAHKGNVAFVMGAFLHDVAKGIYGVRGVNKLGEHSDLGHEDAGVPIAKRICKRLELGKEITSEVLMYVGWHGVRTSTKSKSIKHFLFKFKDNFRNIDELEESFNMLMDFMVCDADGFNDDFSVEIKEKFEAIRLIGLKVVLKEQIFYSNQFNFNASVIAKHPRILPYEIREWIEMFIRNNITEEEAVLKILNKKEIVKC